MIVTLWRWSCIDNQESLEKEDLEKITDWSFLGTPMERETSYLTKPVFNRLVFYYYGNIICTHWLSWLQLPLRNKPPSVHEEFRE